MKGCGDFVTMKLHTDTHAQMRAVPSKSILKNGGQLMNLKSHGSTDLLAPRTLGTAAPKQVLLLAHYSTPPRMALLQCH